MSSPITPSSTPRPTPSAIPTPPVSGAGAETKKQEGSGSSKSGQITPPSPGDIYREATPPPEPRPTPRASKTKGWSAQSFKAQKRGRQEATPTPTPLPEQPTPAPAPTPETGANAGATPRPEAATAEPGSERRSNEKSEPTPTPPSSTSDNKLITDADKAVLTALAGAGAVILAGTAAVLGKVAKAAGAAEAAERLKDALDPDRSGPPELPGPRKREPQDSTPVPRQEPTPGPTRRPDPTRTSTPEATATATETPTSTSTPTPTPTREPTAALIQATPSLEARNPAVDVLQRLDQHAFETIDSTVGRDRFVGLVSEIRAIDHVEPRMVDEIEAYFKRMHVENPDLGYDSKANTAMIRRLREAARGGEVTPTDLEFMKHELLELRLTQHGVPKGYVDRPDGMVWDPAHDVTIEALGQNGMKLYHPEAVNEALASGEDWWQGY
jgi:hypothetical protein